MASSLDELVADTRLLEAMFVPCTPLFADELAAVRAEEKACAVEIFRAVDAEASAFAERAVAMGLVVVRPPVDVPDRVLLVATRPGEEWRAEPVRWELQARMVQRYQRSEASDYFRSRAFGYTHDQAVTEVARLRHASPRYSHDALYLLLPWSTAEEIAASGGRLHPGQVFIVIPPTGSGLRRDVLMPAGVAIGRAAFDWNVLYPLASYRRGRLSILRLASEDVAPGLVSPIDFWSGTAWTAAPGDRAGPR